MVFSNASSKSAEFLARYCNLVLKSSRRERKNEEEEEHTVNTIVSIFGLLDEQDIFFKYYTLLLARRLIYTAYNIDNEMMVISKLKV